MAKKKPAREEDQRPWGHYVVLDEAADHKVKRITVYPGKRLSLQKHSRRSEHWHVIQGFARVTRDAAAVDLGPGDSIDLPCGCAHRMENPGDADLVFIEIQRGDYFGEDDIERLSDDFGRRLK